MKYQSVKNAVFISRPNRFIAHVMLDGNITTVHVKNTGRCKELLIPGCTVYLSESENPNRKTKYDLIAVEKERVDKSTLCINIDSQAPNTVAEEWLKKGGLFSKTAMIRREVIFGRSRFDLYVEDGRRRAFIEVKGVTLEKDGLALFPDAPTQRGIKHISELMEANRQGYETYILFVIQMKEIHCFTPNRDTHLEFAQILKTASECNVKILAMDCIVTPNSIEIDHSIPAAL